MQREINTLLEQRDDALYNLEKVESLYSFACSVLENVGYHYCGGKWKKGFDEKCVCLFGKVN